MIRWCKDLCIILIGVVTARVLQRIMAPLRTVETSRSRAQLLASSFNKLVHWPLCKGLLWIFNFLLGCVSILLFILSLFQPSSKYSTAFRSYTSFVVALALPASYLLCCLSRSPIPSSKERTKCWGLQSVSSNPQITTSGISNIHSPRSPKSRKI